MALFSSLKKIWQRQPAAQDAATNISPSIADAPALSIPVAEWQQPLTLALRDAEPRLSAWLALVLSNVDGPGSLLEERLAFFLSTLDVPGEEARHFVEDFSAWLATMGYSRVDEFRSELQYRLALALDLEDEEDERSRLILKLSEGLAKTRAQLAQRVDALISGHARMDQAFWDELEEILFTADVGVQATQMLLDRLRERAARTGVDKPEAFRALLADELAEIFAPIKRINAINPPEVVLMVGVNGVGKTTTIAKLAYRARLQGKKVLIAGADTFRAAAIEQLEVWAQRTGADFYSKGAGSDPAAVAYEAIERAVDGGYDLLFIDTAGRLHTKINLMEELEKIRRVIGKKHPGAPHRTLLVIDATTGQNALNQTKLFKDAAGVDEIALTKLDGTAKGGVAIAVTLEHKLPITYVGLGERMEDLRPFDGAEFAKALIGDAVSGEAAPGSIAQDTE